MMYFLRGVVNLKDRITFILPAELKRKVKKLCEECGVSMSAFMRTLLLLYLNRPVAIAEEITIQRRRVVVPAVDERKEIWREVQKEIKQVLANRRVD